MASPFPENEIEVLDDYVSDEFIAGMTAGLAAAIGQFENIATEDRDRVEGILSARKRLLDFLQFPDFVASGTVLQPPDSVGTRALLQACIEQMSRRDFQAAEATLNQLAAFPSGPVVLNLGTALRSTPVNFITILTIFTPGGHPPNTNVNINRTLPGYAGPRPSDAAGQRFVSWISFMSGGAERSAGTKLLRAEINFALGKFGDAVSLYDELSGELPPGSDRHKFVVLRSAAASLALGDSLFRKSRNPSQNARAEIRKTYEAARQLMQQSDISPDNPLRQQVEQYAALQIGKLDAGFNFIGYHDNYVPIIKPQVLRDLAERRIARAAEAIAKFELFKSKADQIQDQLADLEFEKDIKAIDNQIAEERLANANDQKRIADKRVEQIQSHIDTLTTDVLVSLGSSLMQGLAAGFAAGQTDGIDVKAGTNLFGAAGAAGGIASTLAGYSARKRDLQTQKEIAGIESTIAGRDVAIAALEQQIVASTLEFLGEKIQRIQNRELNPDLYYAAAETFRSLAERHLDAAIQLAYLFERAVSFLRLKPDLQIILFDYLPLSQPNQQGNVLTAADRLAADLEDVAAENLPITKFQFLTETYSLGLFYPIEFGRFLQTGDMDFTLSLYELNKRRPGVYRQRIKHVDVQIVGNVPATGFTGRIIHRGSFLLRDKDTTPEPGSGQLMPTSERLAEAFAALKSGATQALPIDGVIPFLLDEDTFELSLDQTPPDLDDPSPEALRPIEGYGPAGNWRLEIENMNLRQIADVLLRVTYVIPESDNDLARRVKGLIAAYEQELSPDERPDLITPFSLRQNFQNTFDQLAGGQADLSLARQDFPAGIDELRLKTVVAQALDHQKKGIQGLAVEIARPPTTLALVRSTCPDGFSEDLSLPIPFLPPAERFPVEGTYRLRLPDLSQISQLDDLILFFIYEFKEI